MAVLLVLRGGADSSAPHGASRCPMDCRCDALSPWELPTFAADTAPLLKRRIDGAQGARDKLQLLLDVRKQGMVEGSMLRPS